MKRYFIQPLLLLIAGLFLGPDAISQTSETAATPDIQVQVIYMLIFVGSMMALVTLMLAVTVFYLIKRNQPAVAEDGVTESDQPSFWSTISQKLTDAIPVEKESDIDMGHDYDGIRELDNNLPPWWKYGFYFTIVFGVVYMWIYHISSDWSSDQEYQEEMAEAAVIKEKYLAKVANMVNESNVAVLTDASSIAKGEAIYTANCVACHGAQGQGGIGPNMADKYWLHGGSISDIFATIKYGVPEKGMISWQDQLKPTEMQQVASYILQFQGTTPPNPKDPQGELYEPAEEEKAPVDSTSIASLQ